MVFSRSFFKSKTTWTGIVAIVTAIGAYAQHAIDLPALLGAIAYALLRIFERDTMARLHELIEGMGNGNDADSS